MKTYVMSDIHGCYDKYMEMLDKIGFSEDDTLYVLGDILDRGPHPVKIIQDLMKRPNVVCLAGNHEYMALRCLKFLLMEITDENLDRLNGQMLGRFINWQQNGSSITMDEFYKLDKAARAEVVQFISDFDLYKEISVNDRTYILVHAGLGRFDPNKELWEYKIDDLVWERPDYERPYYSDKYVITGHTPTMTIRSNPNPGYIYKANNHIVIDCGAGFGGKLACMRLETMEEFYVD